jgi:PBP1b-binding outer membrane lipoprotein LpoB
VKQRIAVLVAAAFVLAGCTTAPANEPPPSHPKPNSNQNPDNDAR